MGLHFNYPISEELFSNFGDGTVTGFSGHGIEEEEIDFIVCPCWDEEAELFLEFGEGFAASHLVP